jgi:hypothetical protein
LYFYFLAILIFKFKQLGLVIPCAFAAAVVKGEIPREHRGTKE